MFEFVEYDILEIENEDENIVKHITIRVENSVIISEASTLHISR